MTKSAHKPNIVWIVLDTHRYDRLGVYGSPRGASPNLDAFAQSATVFEHAIAPGQWTIPSHASMFTGEFPTTHLTTQSGDALDPYFRTAAEWLRAAGYATTGFCNNPLVGVLGNGLKRGFDIFYNYGGAVPSKPAHALRQPVRLLSQVWERYTQLLRRISYPVQNTIARSDSIFRLTLNPTFVPLWTRFANFKGDTRESLADASDFIHKRLTSKRNKPQMVFLNLMETHLPLAAPEPFTSRLAPILKEERAARDFMRVYNTLALRWLLPMEEPFAPLEAQALSESYDAEVAYQDHLLAALLEQLDTPHHREHTAVIIVADHGEMLGEHRLMGHGFGVYEELVRVPLMVRLPGQTEGRRVRELVSTAQLFHTMLDLAGVEGEALELLGSAPERFSLRRIESRPAAPLVFSEAYPPQNVIKILEKENPALLAEFAGRAVVRAAYNQMRAKVMDTEGIGRVFYALDRDAGEASDAADNIPAETRLALSAGLETFRKAAIERRPENWVRRAVSIEDKALLQRLRSLGYIE